jgi:predicted ATPase
MVVTPLDHALPPSIVGALRQRFERLSAQSIDHLRVAAIIGRTFDLSLLAAVQEQEVEAVEAGLLEAARARLIRADQTGTFTFNHDKIRECLYAEVSTSRRRRLHGLIGGLLEAQYGQEQTMNVHQLAALAWYCQLSIIMSLFFSQSEEEILIFGQFTPIFDEIARKSSL